MSHIAIASFAHCATDDNCPDCGHEFAYSLSAGCLSDDCPSHDSIDEQLEQMQMQAEDNLLRQRGRYLRPERVYQG